MISDELVPQDDFDLEDVFAMLGAFSGGGYLPDPEPVAAVPAIKADKRLNLFLRALFALVVLPLFNR